jgi:RNA polymerase primary sigma factor
MAATRPKHEVQNARTRFFRELRDTPILTHDQEVELAKEMERGEKAVLDAVAASPVLANERTEPSRAPSHERLAPETVKGVLAKLDRLAKAPGAGPDSGPAKTAKAIRRGRRRTEQARATLIQANVRLVVWMAKKQANRGLPLLDLVQEGNVGLMRAADKFDWRRGVRFNTYAAWWIRQAINRALSNSSRTIRIPVHLVETHRKVAQTLQRFANEHGRDATAEEAARETGVPLAKIRELMDAPREPVSFDATVGFDSETKLGDLVPDLSVVSPLEEIASSRLPEQMRRLLRTLTPREQEVLKMRFGIDHPGNVTLQEVGNLFALSRERVRQIESQALSKLRVLAESEELDAHLAS